VYKAITIVSIITIIVGLYTSFVEGNTPYWFALYLGTKGIELMMFMFSPIICYFIDMYTNIERK
jgi:hypothetical protein